jgi:hypothetical protein
MILFLSSSALALFSGGRTYQLSRLMLSGIFTLRFPLATAYFIVKDKLSKLYFDDRTTLV